MNVHLTHTQRHIVRLADDVLRNFLTVRGYGRLAVTPAFRRQGPNISVILAARIGDQRLMARHLVPPCYTQNMIIATCVMLVSALGDQFAVWGMNQWPDKERRPYTPWHQLPEERQHVRNVVLVEIEDGCLLDTTVMGSGQVEIVTLDWDEIETNPSEAQDAMYALAEAIRTADGPTPVGLALVEERLKAIIAKHEEDDDDDIVELAQDWEPSDDD